MRDKAFDQLFRDKFEGAEVTPSDGLWAGIAAELGPGQKKPLTAYWWSAAAIAGIALAVGLLFPQTETIRLHGQAMVSVQPETQEILSDRPATRKTGIAESAPVSGNEVSTPLVIAPRSKDEIIVENDRTVQPLEQLDHPVVEGKEVLAATEETVKELPAMSEEVVIANAGTLSVQDRNAEQEQDQEHKGIRNVGDLVNFVVGKVDKRENKIVQFDTDDDNSSLVSLNLGIIRFNKRSNK